MSKRPAQAQEPGSGEPFSRPLDVHAVPDSGLDLAIEASVDDRAAIAVALGLVDLGTLTAVFRIERRAGHRLVVEGRLQATVTQMCVISLEPFDSRIERSFEMIFASPVDAAGAAPARSRRREAKPEPPRPIVVPAGDDEEEPPDPIVDGRIDLGAVTLEFLTLSLDLYPRKPGVHFTDVSIGDKDEAKESPFAALQRLKDRS